MHGGPCCSEIPYVRKYQDLLEQSFTVVHYDQRGSGKSYELGVDYSDVSASTHVEDLIALTKYIEEYLQREQVILIGHSYGTYIATMAATREPALYRAYVGIGQMPDTVNSETGWSEKMYTGGGEYGRHRISQRAGTLISQGQAITPRENIRKYGFAARNVDEDADYLKGLLFGSEYNLLDTIRFYTASGKYQDALIMEALQKPISDIVTEAGIPFYFVMGKYDCMTSPEAAEQYLNRLGGQASGGLILFEESAHYPRFEEKEKFYQWMCDTFAAVPRNPS